MHNSPTKARSLASSVQSRGSRRQDTRELVLSDVESRHSSPCPAPPHEEIAETIEEKNDDKDSNFPFLHPFLSPFLGSFRSSTPDVISPPSNHMYDSVNPDNPQDTEGELLSLLHPYIAGRGDIEQVRELEMTDMSNDKNEEEEEREEDAETRNHSNSHTELYNQLLLPILHMRSRSNSQVRPNFRSGYESPNASNASSLSIATMESSPEDREMVVARGRLNKVKNGFRRKSRRNRDMDSSRLDDDDAFSYSSNQSSPSGPSDKHMKPIQEGVEGIEGEEKDSKFIE